MSVSKTEDMSSILLQPAKNDKGVIIMKEKQEISNDNFKPKNLKRRKLYFEPSEKYFMLILFLFFIAFIVGMFDFSKINDNKGVIPSDYSTVINSEKIATHTLYFQESSVATGIIDDEVYYIFNTIDNNELSETFFIPESKTKVFISDKNYVDVYEESITYHRYNKYLKKYDHTDKTEYFYNIFITPQQINNLGTIREQGKTFSYFTFFPYFFFYH